MMPEATGNEFVDGAAGASAQREHDRRRAGDEAKTRAQWGRFGDIAVALSNERQSTKAWSSGAAGEQAVGRRLDAIASPRIRVLHDRRIPGSRANIDHIVVTASGVWVIDAKRYKDKRPELRVEGGVLRPRVEKLIVGRSDKTALVDGVLGQIGHVERFHPDVPVRGALCFVDADWPMFGGSFTTRGVAVVWPRKLAELIQKSAAGDADVAAIARDLGTVFRSA